MQIVTELRPLYRLADLLRLTGLSPSTYYYDLACQDRPDRDRVLKDEIKAIYHENNGLYGYRRIHLQLCNNGWKVNRKAVQRLMQVLHLHGKSHKARKYRSYRGAVGTVADNLLHREFRATGPDEKWVSDISEFKSREGKVYLSPIIDLFNQEMVSWDISFRPDFEQVTRMLERSFDRLGNGKHPIFHTDQGWQYQMDAFTTMLSEHGLVQSMSRKGNCLDNAMAENFFSIVKNEMFYGRKPYRTREELKVALEEYIGYYNNVRIKAGLGDLSPVPYRRRYWSKEELHPAFRGQDTHYAEEGFAGVMSYKRHENSDNARRKMDGRTEAEIIRVACGPVPEGHARWTLRLLEAKARAELDVPVSRSTIARTLKKTGFDLTAMHTGASRRRRTYSP
ncbi:MAG: IS3 family transposase [Spirochaetia bacterium]|nr:IS3 family transposase [Spirochaetia bacterium]